MFQPYHNNQWRRGCILVSEPDAIPEDALRRAVNVRLDRTLGSIESRPGWTAKTSAALGGVITFLSRLFTSVATYDYAQIGTDLQRLSAWAGGTSIATPGSQVVSSANCPDGQSHLLKYFVNGTIAIKDDGTTATTMGIAPPTAAPTSVALATDLSTTISAMDDHTDWTGSSVGGKADETNIKQEGTGSVTFTVAASTFGYIAQYLGAAVDLDTLTGGDDLVKDDDYIHLWVRIDRPERLTYIQIDIDCDADTTGVADAFRENYYSWRGGALAVLSQGTDQWNKLQVRKSEFARYGSDTAVDWSLARTFRIGFLTNSLGTATIYVDDFKLRGGVGMEGEIEYTICYRNSSTKGRGNPPKDSDGIVLYTDKITTDRQRINLTISNVIQGGANHPGDTQIDTIMVWRKGGTFETAALVEEIADTATSPFLDDNSDETLVLVGEFLETDNDAPPPGTTRVLFGPDASGRMYMIVDGFRLYISKPYEDGENRAENYPALGFALLGDGSAKGVCGIATATQVRAWTTERSYNIIGRGQDTLVPVALDGTRGAVGQFAATEGDGYLFFISQDGIYQDRSGQQVKLTGAIDKFFQGITVDGQLGWNTSSSAMALARLEFLHEATGSALVMIYAEAGASTPNRFLVLKPSLETGALTECFFGLSALTNLRSLYLDTINLQMLAGGDNQHVYRIEDPSAYDDAGTAIAITSRGKSYDFGQPQRSKFIAHAVVEGLTTNQNLTLAAYYDRAATSEVLGTVNTPTETSLVQLATADPEARHRDIALELTGSVSARVAITRLGCFFEPQPELLTYLDSGLVSFDFKQQLKRFEIDINLPSDSTLTVYADGVQVFQGQFVALGGRRNVPYPLPAGVRGRVLRVTLLSSGDPFLCYKLSAFTKQLGTDQAYTERIMVQGV